MKLILKNEDEKRKQEEWKKKNIELYKNSIRKLEKASNDIHEAMLSGYSDGNIRREIEKIIKDMEKRIKDGVF